MRAALPMTPAAAPHARPPRPPVPEPPNPAALPIRASATVIAVPAGAVTASTASGLARQEAAPPRKSDRPYPAAAASARIVTTTVPHRTGSRRGSVGILISIVHYNDRHDDGNGAVSEPSDITIAVARTLQALRADRGWSLDQLAARSGVSKGVLVALEQGRSNPNLATLARIGDAFGVPVTRLVETGGEPTVQVSNPAAARVLWHGPSGGSGTILGATDPPCGRAVALGPDARRDVRRRRPRPGHPRDGLGRIRHAHALGGGRAPRTRPRPVRPLPGRPPAPLQQRGHRPGPPDHGRGHPAGRGLTGDQTTGHPGYCADRLCPGRRRRHDRCARSRPSLSLCRRGRSFDVTAGPSAGAL